MDYLDFSKKIKSKYSQYAGIDDLELAQKIVSKHPEYKSVVTFDAPVEQQAPAQTPQAQSLIAKALPYIAKAAGPLTGGVIPSAAAEVLVDPQKRQVAEEVSSMPMRGLRGLGVTAASGLERGAEAVQPGFTPQGGAENLAALGASVADPRMAVLNPAVGEGLGLAANVIKKSAQFVGKELSEAFGALSGAKPQNIKMLAQNPMEVLKADSSKITGKLFQKAKEALNVTNREERMITRAGTSSDSIAERMIGKYESGKEMSVGEILAAKKATSQLANKQKGVYGPWFDKFDALLKEKAPKVAAAQAEVAKSKTKEAFTRIFPYNKNKSAAVVRMLAGAGLVGGGSYSNHPVLGAMGAALMSPALVGAGTVGAAGAMGAAKGLNVLGQNPAVRQTLLGLLEKMRGDKK